MGVDAHDLFARLYRGDNAGVLARTVESGVPVGPDIAAPVIGALTFLGRVDEARYLLTAVEGPMSPAHRTIARAFLTIELARRLRFDDAVGFLKTSARERHDHQDPAAHCLFFQSGAIYRFFSSRYSLAQRWAARARGEAALGGFLYGRVCAMDLLGHIQVALGDIHGGLELLDRTRTLAASMGHGWLVDSIRVATTCYQARHGMLGEETVPSLRDLLESDMAPDSFNRPDVLLQLARHLLLTGRRSEAIDVLASAGGQIYKNRNDRFDCEVALVTANAYFIEGNLARAMALLDTSLERISGKRQHHLEHALGGLRGTISRAQGDTAPAPFARQSTLPHLSRRMQARARGDYDLDRSPGRDPLGDLIDRVHLEREQAFLPIIDSGYLALLIPALRLDPGSQLIAIDTTHELVVVIDRGDVSALRNVPALSRRLLCQFASGEPQSKEALCERVWGFQYHPERHDASIYNAISKLRRLHPRLDGWVRVTHDGYALQPGVEVRLLRAAPAAVPKEPTQDTSSTLARIASEHEINLRQCELLALVSERGVVSPRGIRDVFEVSEITASRDLRTLAEKGLLTRVGKGRATKYTASASLEAMFPDKESSHP